MDQVVPWQGLVALIKPHYPKGDRGRPAYPLLAMLRVHLLQKWFYKQIRKIEKAKAQVRAKVEHPFRVIKRQFGYVKVRFRGLAKNTKQLVTLFALSSLWMARRRLLTNAGEVSL